MKAHGVPWLIRHLDGEISLDEAAAGAIMDTRRYAKRQLTWFRNQMKDWPWAAAEEAEKALESQLGRAKLKNALDRARDDPYKPRNESTGGHDVAQYYYSRSRGSDAASAALTGARQGSVRTWPSRAFFIGGEWRVRRGKGRRP